MRRPELSLEAPNGLRGYTMPVCRQVHIRRPLPR